MNSLFIGLTLGGLPVVWRLARPGTPSPWIGAAAAFLGMSLLALAQRASAAADDAGSGVLILLVAGLFGAGFVLTLGTARFGRESEGYLYSNSRRSRAEAASTASTRPMTAMR